MITCEVRGFNFLPGVSGPAVAFQVSSFYGSKRRRLCKTVSPFLCSFLLTFAFTPSAFSVVACISGISLMEGICF